MSGLPAWQRRRPRDCAHALRHASIQVFVLAATIGGIGSTFAATIHVPADHPTIQAAVTAATNGDIVVVSAGTYVENVDFLSKAIVLRSESGPQSTIIDGNLAGPVIYMTGVPATAGVFGFTIRHGIGPFGSGISLLGSSPRITGNVFASNPELTGYYGAAVGGNGASPIIDDNLFYDNSCDSQFDTGVLAFVNSSSPQIHDNVIRDNDCRGISMTLPEGNTPVVYNNTIVRNRTGVYVAAGVPTASQTFRNNIIAFNNVGLEVAFSFTTFDAVWRNNLFFGNGANATGVADPTGTNNNIVGDPHFANPTANDFRLVAGSAAIDSGDAMGLAMPTTDYGGAPRLADGNGDGIVAVDIGAFEAPQPVALLPAQPVPSLGAIATLALAMIVAVFWRRGFTPIRARR